MAEGVDLIGEYEGSGYKEPPSLARRGDGQVIQLTPLLYALAELADGRRSRAEIAEELTRQLGRKVTVANVTTLIEVKLQSLGILAQDDGSNPETSKPDPLLALKFRAAVISEDVSQAIGSSLRPLFLPPVILAALAALVATDYWLFVRHGVAQALRQALYSPGVFLIILAAIIMSAAFHETGHAAGCRYGGGKPGKMGCGLYLAWPAFYTDVTDAYRLGRRGRLRTDLGGVYFNVIFVVGTIGLYVVTGYEPLLLIIVAEHAEIVHQLLPIIRLDGYYIVADLTGVPDLFARIKPILSSMVPGRRADEKVLVLKRWVRVAVTAWVLIVVPLLLVQLLILLVQLPRILGTAYNSLTNQWNLLSAAYGKGNFVGGTAGVLQVIALVLPIVGIVLMLGRVAQRSAKTAWTRTSGRPLARSGVVVIGLALVGLLGYVWVPKGNYSPISRTDRGTLGQGVAAVNPANLTHLEGVAPTRAPDTTVPTPLAPTTTVPATPAAPTSTTPTRVSPTTVASHPGVTTPPAPTVPTTALTTTTRPQITSTTVAGATATTSP